jgi:hypothetical protein
MEEEGGRREGVESKDGKRQYYDYLYESRRFELDQLDVDRPLLWLAVFAFPLMADFLRLSL